ncbi:MAG: glycosyltransferase [Bacteroidetes bacterium]|uniref:Glycosyltransferase n=1 Tax=Candidatus Egerieousia excrementavium TaxID=2840778 RepID=A0A9D9DJZ3_9BACT|nr:glycosyltransferase [Candidatus Egerieousia excrementavium]
MKVLIVSDARSTHTRRWVKSLKDSGVEVALFSPNPVSDNFFGTERIRLYCYDLFSYKRKGKPAPARKILRHMGAVRALKRAIKIEQPELLHAHYLTSYALIAALTRFHPLVISVWGSDIYEFPHLSALNRLTVKYSLRHAERVCSTSHIMARECAKYYSGEITVIPFGVDTSLFRKMEEYEPQKGTFVVGTVKTMAPKYGIDTLIKAFSTVVKKHGSGSLKLVIVGDGPCLEEYRQLAASLALENVEFRGRVENSLLPQVYNSFSIAASISNSESFGVVAVEAMACQCPVITSDADGFTEVVENGVTGIIVPRADIQATAMAIEYFMENPGIRERMGAAGRERVLRLYKWHDNVAAMIQTYRNCITEYEQ